MIPITKNIIVVDERGNEYEATYPKRAKGLVKNGRARFVNENKICLACPPNKILEDKKVENNYINEQTATQVTTTEKPIALNMEYVLTRIDKIMDNNYHIKEAFETIKHMELNGSLNGGDSARAEAISNTVQSRETTNQQLIKFLEKIYDDLKPQKVKTAEDISIVQMLTDRIDDLPPDEKSKLLMYQLNKVL